MLPPLNGDRRHAAATGESGGRSAQFRSESWLDRATYRSAWDGFRDRTCKAGVNGGPVPRPASDPLPGVPDLWLGSNWVRKRPGLVVAPRLHGAPLAPDPLDGLCVVRPRVHLGISRQDWEGDRLRQRSGIPDSTGNDGDGRGGGPPSLGRRRGRRVEISTRRLLARHRRRLGHVARHGGRVRL